MSIGRTDWATTWMGVAEAVSKRSKCVRRQIGAVIVSQDNSQIWVGYNGPPAHWLPALKDPNSLCDSWCERAKYAQSSAGYDNCITIHAEKNALIKSDPNLRKSGTLYVTSFPCWDCAKSIANSGISTIVTRYDAIADEHRMPKQTRLMLTDSGLAVAIYGHQSDTL